MRSMDRFALALLLSAAAVAYHGEAGAARCTDDAQIQAARVAIQAACQCPESGRGAFLRCARRSLRNASQAKSCRKAALREVANSICGRSSQFIVCCRARGRRLGSIVRNANRCRNGETCPTASRTPVGSANPVFLSSVDDVCTAESTCVTTTTTTSSTTTTSTTSTTSTTAPPCPAAPGGAVHFEISESMANCGQVTSDAAGTVPIAALACGGLNIGGGNSTTPEGPTPGGSVSRFGLGTCTGTSCPIVCSDAQPPGATCTNAGCYFGVPLPVNGTPSTCVQNRFASPASGTIDLATGVTTDLSIDLSSTVYLTSGAYIARPGGVQQGLPCPVCVNDTTNLTPVSGSQATPGTGVCNGGARAGQPCTTRNPNGLTTDCEPGGTSNGTTCAPGSSCTDAFGVTVGNLGSIAVNLSPLRTDTVTLSNADGLFCPGQTVAGCFDAAIRLKNPAATGAQCRSITASGTPFAGNLADQLAHAGVLASAYCIPATSSPIVNAAAALPGPGEVTLPGTMRFIAP